MKLAFARLERRFRALAFGDFFGGDVNADNLSALAAQGMPVGDP